MPRAATTSDAFNAVAEPRRREILNFLSLEERPVGDIVDSLKLEQPSVSKHLRVLRETGLVNARRDGRRMLYRTNAEAIRPLYEWTSIFERFWRQQLSRIRDRAETKEERGAESDPTRRGGKHDPDPSGN
ncbi:MAG: helix-turn-helix transcriptional regulator [Acidobacteria bacterium Pan2503]|uniref:Helix-turn-helix transcriptional regulator n=1 Tax=Candidatus Acidiferrum panamense TaxID=2741543 RepID=A0A7V8NQ93_9BACT|nr:helix-turn-helix transcriptional regulator [Candidatus Acidoferrum panamensis]